MMGAEDIAVRGGAAEMDMAQGAFRIDWRVPVTEPFFCLRVVGHATAVRVSGELSGR